MSDLSVIVPVYNVEKYLERSLDSLINQTYKALEIIIVNDGSTDSSREILRKYENLENVYIFDKENEGVSYAREYGLKKVKTEYVTFVDSDDFIDLDLYEISMEKIKENKNTDMLMFNHYIYINKEQIKVNDLGYNTEFTYTEDIIKSFLLNKIGPYFWNKIFKTYLFKDIKFPPRDQIYEDIITISDVLFKNTKSLLVWNKPKYYYLQRENSISNSVSEKTIVDYVFAVSHVEKKIKELKKSNDFLIELELFKTSRVVKLMRMISKLEIDKPISYKLSLIALNININILNKAKKIYGLNNRYFIINLLFSFNKKYCYYFMHIIRKLKKSNDKLHF